MTMFNDFKAFILRGNVVDLAVAVVIGAAFKTVVDALVSDLITPILAMFGGRQSFRTLHFTINDSVFLYGDFLTQVLSFVIIAAVVFFFVVVPINKLMDLRKTEVAADPLTRECPFCVSWIPAKAKRCPFCTSEVAAA